MLLNVEKQYKNGKDDQRIFYSASGSLYCVNALSGKPILSFGTDGKIDLHQDLGVDASNLYVASTTPGMIYKDMIIVGTRVAEEAAAKKELLAAADKDVCMYVCMYVWRCFIHSFLPS